VRWKEGLAMFSKVDELQADVQAVFNHSARE